MANYNPNERNRRTTGGDWWEDDGYRADNYGNRDQYDDYPRINTRNRGNDDYDNYGYEASNFGRGYGRGYNTSGSYGGEYGDRYRSMQRGYGSYSDSDYNYGQRNNYGNYGSYGGSGYNEGQQSFRGGYGSDYQSGYGGRDRLDIQHLRSSRDMDYRGEFGDSYGGNDYNRSYRNRMGSNRDYERYRGDDDRDWWDRTTDEVASWFGDEDAERRRRMDKQREGGHRGRGPKGYRRSDDRIREDINDRLYEDPWIDASDVEVTVANGEVTLSGSVNEKLAKRRAEDIAESVSGVLHVENRIRVGQGAYQTNTANYPTATTTAGATNTNSKAESSQRSSTGSR